jgi:hypothetical protein
MFSYLLEKPEWASFYFVPLRNISNESKDDIIS